MHRAALTLLLALPLLYAQSQLEANLEAARKDALAAPNDLDKQIWLGRRLGYLGRYDEAIETFTKAAALDPSNPKPLRHRGHRYISTRRFDLAIADFTRAAKLIQGKPDEIEPDGQPNKLNKPLSTLQFNIYYHLGLAHYLKGDFKSALKAYNECMKRSRNNDDSLVATTDWLYMTLRRLKRDADAAKVLVPITEQMTIIENDSYWKRLLMYKGLRTPESLLDAKADDLSIATQGYGVGNWYLYNGQTDKAKAVFERVVAGKQKSAFGYIAAEADLARLGK
jgi:tetratricopeptide (TPR) repeat protein